MFLLCQGARTWKVQVIWQSLLKLKIPLSCMVQSFFSRAIRCEEMENEIAIQRHRLITTMSQRGCFCQSLWGARHDKPYVPFQSDSPNIIRLLHYPSEVLALRVRFTKRLQNEFFWMEGMVRTLHHPWVFRSKKDVILSKSSWSSKV